VPSGIDEDPESTSISPILLLFCKDMKVTIVHGPHRFRTTKMVPEVTC